MVDTVEPSFDRPIPGMSLTAELGNRPWQQPPQYSTVEEALQWYIPRLTNPELLDQLLDVMETGIPLTTIANAMQIENQDFVTELKKWIRFSNADALKNCDGLFSNCMGSPTARKYYYIATLLEYSVLFRVQSPRLSFYKL